MNNKEDLIISGSDDSTIIRFWNKKIIINGVFIKH